MQVWPLTNDFGQFLPPQWNSGQFGADPAEPSAQDPLGLLAVGREAVKRDDATGNQDRRAPRELLTLLITPSPTQSKHWKRTPRPPVCHSLVLVVVSAEAAAAQQREQHDQQEGDQGSGRDHTHPLVGL